jgi:hypothetical protein
MGMGLEGRTPRYCPAAFWQAAWASVQLAGAHVVHPSTHTMMSPAKVVSHFMVHITLWHSARHAWYVVSAVALQLAATSVHGVKPGQVAVVVVELAPPAPPSA